MKLLIYNFIMLCGLLSTLAAFPIFGQETVSTESVLINKRPLKDFSLSITDKMSRKDLDVAASFIVVLEGMIGKDGRLDKETARFTKTEGSSDLIGIAKEGIEALNDSGFFTCVGRLSDQSRPIKITVEQNDTNLNASFELEMETETKARTTRSALASLAGMGTHTRKNQLNLSQNDRDDILILENVKAENSGKSVAINLRLPKAVAQEMIQRRLIQLSEKQQMPVGAVPAKN